MAEPQVTYCPRDPDTETNLRCGRCGELICPNCLVQTDVGSRCQSCANVRTPPMFRTDAGEFLRASGAAVGTALVVAILADIILAILGLRFGGVVAVGGAGWLIGEVVYRASGYKQTKGLQFVAGLATLLAFVLVTPFEPAGAFIGLIIGTYYAIQRLKPPRGV